MRSAVCLCLLAAAAIAQTGAPAGAISGQVVSKETGAPVRGAIVFAMRGMREEGSAWTGADGRFRIARLPAGVYQLTVVKPSLRGATRGAEVRAGEETKGVDLALDGPAIVAGKVFDGDGLPVEGAAILPLGVGWYFGRPNLSRAAVGVETDDRGEYRFSPSQPGGLYLSLQPPVRPGVSGQYRLLHPPMFHPNARHPAEAQPLEMRAGGKIENADFEVPPVAKTQLRVLARAGKLGEKPRSCVRCSFLIAARTGGLWLPVLSGQADGQGAFEVDGLQPGAYRVSVAGKAAETMFAGYTETAVEEGRLAMEEVIAYAPTPAPVQITLVDPPEELRSASARWSGRLEAGLVDLEYPLSVDDGTEGENIRGIGAGGAGSLGLHPGDWAVLWLTAPDLPRAYIADVRVAGHPQRGPVVRVPQTGFAPPVEVRLGFATAAVSGTVAGLRELDPRVDRRRAFVLAIPEPGDGYGRREETPVMSGGRFEIQRLPPGGYLLFALPPGGYSFPLDLADPAVQRRYAAYGKRIDVGPGDSLEVELKAIP